MLEFADILYGRIELPDWVAPFLRLPEFVRLRGVRLSNVDSLEFKDFAGPTRWEHGIATAYLATRCADRRGLPHSERVQLVLAALLHDVATPPFGHTVEHVLDDFDHERETERVLSALPSKYFTPGAPVYGSSLPQFASVCRQVAARLGMRIDPDEVAKLVVGAGDLGFLVSGAVDLDNADNVTRGCLYMGIPVDRRIPLRVAEWLAEQEEPPTDLSRADEPAVREWLRYREEYYGRFYTSSDQELGRQAFLQHLMRRALDCGLTSRALIWTTDDALLSAVAALPEGGPSVWRAGNGEIVERYRLLEPTQKFLHYRVESEEVLRAFRQPHAAAWLERKLSGRDLEAFVLVSTRRFQTDGEGELFGPERGVILAFHLGPDLRHRDLPDWLRGVLPERYTGKRLRQALAQALAKDIPRWAQDRPWLVPSTRRVHSVVQSLKSIGDWSFRLSRNESLHAYPSTFVHAIPASLLHCLELKGETVLDPFGGTGQTACEVIRLEGSAISADSNTVACLAARAKLTYLPDDERAKLSAVSAADLLSVEPSAPPQFDLRSKWHHPRTLMELRRIKAFIESWRDERGRQFLLACLSSAIPDTTGRKGKQHGFFADNTPLAGNIENPPYQNAADLFVARVSRNLSILGRFYAFIERSGRSPVQELCRARVVQLDARSASVNDYGVPPRSVAAIITSPPYLCMADYTLGQRLSYHWIAPDAMDADFRREIGARRLRSRPEDAAKAYFESLGQFATNALHLLRPGGFLAIVLGAPVARAFKGVRVLERVDSILAERGFDLIWNQWRPIHWHRNQGYQRLRQERVAVYTAP